MKNRVLPHSAVLLIFCGLAVYVTAHTRETVPQPEKFKISVELDKPKFFLGELILLHYCVENTGATPFIVSSGGDYRGYGRPNRYKVTGTDQNKQALLDPLRNFRPFMDGGIGSSSEIKPGEKWWGSIDLHEFLEVNGVGILSVSVAHDLGWENSEAKNRTASVELEIVEPTQEQARELTLRALEKERDWGLTGHRTPPTFDVKTLRYAVYLPFLKEHAVKDTDVGKRAREGLQQIESVESTMALIDSATDATEKAKSHILEIVNERIPDPRFEITTGIDSFYMKYGDGNRRKIRCEASWKPDMAERVRAIARILLRGALREYKQPAYTMYCLGTKEDANFVMSALDGALQLTTNVNPDAYNRAHFENLSNELRFALSKLFERGFRPPTPIMTHSQCAAYLLAMKTDPTFRPERWQRTCGNLVQHDVPSIRVAAWEFVPRPLTEAQRKLVVEQLSDVNRSVQDCAVALVGAEKIVEAREELLRALDLARADDTRKSALSVAVKMGWRYDALQRIAKDIGAKPEYWRTVNVLIDDIVVPTAGAQRESKDEDMRLLRERWINFLQSNKERIDAGYKFKPGEDGLDPKLFYRKVYHLNDKTTWPRD